MGKGTRRLLAVVVVLVTLAAACGDDDGGTGGDGAAGEGSTLRVPGDHETIQAAVDAASPGDLILVEPGTYEEEVNVTTDDLTIRGLDRNEVVLEGNFELENGVRVLEADGVVVENMTAQNYTGNGFFWTGVDGFRGSYLTAIRNGDYGVYTFGSRNGVLEHLYGSGSPDAGFYVGQCYPCNTLINDVVSEFNGLGYSGTNSGGDLWIVNSVFRRNKAGIVPNSGSYEGCAPERETTIVGNLVHDNDNFEVDGIDAAILASGNGILVTGGVDNVIERNRIQNHPVSGIALVPFPEDDPIAPITEEPSADCVEDAVAAPPEEVPEGTIYWPASGNQVVDNVVEGSGEWDLVVITLDQDALGNCFEGNEATITAPEDISTVLPCEGEQQPYEPEIARFLEIVETDRGPVGDYQTVELPDPGDLEGMEDPENAPTSPGAAPEAPDLESITVPDAP